MKSRSGNFRGEIFIYVLGRKDNVGRNHHACKWRRISQNGRDSTSKERILLLPRRGSIESVAKSISLSRSKGIEGEVFKAESDRQSRAATRNRRSELERTSLGRTRSGRWDGWEIQWQRAGYYTRKLNIRLAFKSLEIFDGRRFEVLSCNID